MERVLGLSTLTPKKVFDKQIDKTTTIVKHTWTLQIMISKKNCSFQLWVIFGIQPLVLGNANTLYETDCHPKKFCQLQISSNYKTTGPSLKLATNQPFPKTGQKNFPINKKTGLRKKHRWSSKGHSDLWVRTDGR